MSSTHPYLTDRSTYPSNRYHALLSLIHDVGGSGITLTELIECEWFGTPEETKTLVETFTEHRLLDTVKTTVPDETRTLIIPGKELTTASETDIEFAINVLSDA